MEILKNGIFPDFSIEILQKPCFSIGLKNGKFFSHRIHKEFIEPKNLEIFLKMFRKSYVFLQAGKLKEIGKNTIPYIALDISHGIV